MDVGVRELRDHLSRLRAQVRSGSTITVTDHGQPIARIVPVDRPTALEALTAAGKVTRAERGKSRLPDPVEASGSVRDLIADQRPLIAYLDTSAFVPPIVREPGSAACREVWDLADEMVSSRLLYVETAAALAQALRLGRLTTGRHTVALASLDEFWAAMDVVEIDAELVWRAATLAFGQGLRGHDAVHCASAERLADPELVVAAGDRRLLAALSAVGLDTIDVAAT